METTIRVTLRREGNQVVARCRQPPLSARGDSEEEALIGLQEALTLALEGDYPGRFGGNFSAEATMVALEVVRDENT